MKYLLINLLMISVLLVVGSNANQFLDTAILNPLNFTHLERIITEKISKMWNLNMDNPSPNYTYVIVSLMRPYSPKPDDCFCTFLREA